jgi:hypothetical protein
VVAILAGFSQYRTDKVARIENKPRLLPFFVLLATTPCKTPLLFYRPQLCPLRTRTTGAIRHHTFDRSRKPAGISSMPAAKKEFLIKEAKHI